MRVPVATVIGVTGVSELRVLHVIGAMDLAGAETMIMNLYRNVDRDIVQFDFLVHADRPCAYDAEIEELGGRIHRIELFRGSNLLSYRSACKEALAVLAQDHPVVHGHIGAPAAIYLSEAKRQGCFAIAHSHNTNGPLSLEELSFQTASFPTRFIADYFFACSRQAGIDRYGKHVVEGDNFAVIPNGIDARAFTFSQERRAAARAQLGLTDELVVGHVGRFEAAKNHSFLLNAFAALHQKRPDAKLALVGSGSLLEQSKAQAGHLGISDAVLFLGNRTDMGDVLATFDVYAFPSIVEGFGVALLEAQAAGLPCLVSEAIQDEAIVTPSVSRVTLASGAEAWAKELLRLSQEPIRRQNGFRAVQAHGFDVHETAQQLQQFYLDHQGRPSAR